MPIAFIWLIQNFSVRIISSLFSNCLPQISAPWMDECTVNEYGTPQGGIIWFCHIKIHVPMPNNGKLNCKYFCKTGESLHYPQRKRWYIDVRRNRINSQARGMIQYYQCCTWVNLAMHKYTRRLQLIAKSRLKQHREKWIPANQTQNLPHIHQQRKRMISSIKYRNIYVGFTALAFCKWENIFPKNQSDLTAVLLRER